MELHPDCERILFTPEQIAAAVDGIAQRLNADYAGKTVYMVCILKGASTFYSDLVRRLTFDVRFDFMCVSSYGSATASSGAVCIRKDLDSSIKDMDVIIVEDIVDSGLTMRYLTENLLSRDPKSINICALMDKPSRREVPVEVKYSGMEIPNAFVVGYGLDYAERYRNLPYIAVLRREIYAPAACTK
ncbi:MAG: hypoxanthine phosphoribosyltransferase [Firmicutes bacterium]|nr:hypoxanthine phosphoribosyltransferase [Bacillota bacterium]